MSLIIKGIDIPKNGDYTFHFASDENGENTIVLIRNNLTGTVLVNNGVIQIPKGHGRLGDLDKLYATFGYSAQASMNPQLTVLNVPTILEAEVE